MKMFRAFGASLYAAVLRAPAAPLGTPQGHPRGGGAVGERVTPSAFTNAATPSSSVAAGSPGTQPAAGVPLERRRDALAPCDHPDCPCAVLAPKAEQ